MEAGAGEETGLAPPAQPPLPLFLLPPVMAEYGTLLQDLTNNITLEDLEQLKSACKEDIPSEKSEEITTGSAWFSFLESHNKLDKGGRGPRPLGLSPGGGSEKQGQGRTRQALSSPAGWERGCE